MGANKHFVCVGFICTYMGANKLNVYSHLVFQTNTNQYNKQIQIRTNTNPYNKQMQRNTNPYNIHCPHLNDDDALQYGLLLLVMLFCKLVDSKLTQLKRDKK